MANFRSWLRRALHLAILSVFFLAAWWTPLTWSSDFMQAHVEFLIEIPALLTVGLWLLLGTPGLGYILGDWRRGGIAGMVPLVLWDGLPGRWWLYPDDTVKPAQQFAVVDLFCLFTI